MRRKNWCCCHGFQFKYVRQVLEIYLFRLIRLWPALIATLLFFNNAIFFLGEGPTWSAIDDLYKDCDRNWWTVLFFMNDVVPYYVKDLKGCMRFTAVYSIEFKLFLFLPVLLLFYHKGYRRAVVVVCLLLMAICYIVVIKLF